MHLFSVGLPGMMAVRNSHEEVLVRTKQKIFPLRVHSWNVVLRELLENDAHALYALKSEGRTNVYPDLPEVRRGIARCAQSTRTELGVWECHTLVGTVTVTPLGHGRVEFADAADLSYWIGQPYRGRGLATDVVRAVVSHLLHSGAYARLFAYTPINNRASQRVLAKVGFTRISGTRLDYHFFAFERK